MLGYQIDGHILSLTVSTYPTLAARQALFDAVRADRRVTLGALVILDVRSLALDLGEANVLERLGALITLLGPKLGRACAIIRDAHQDDSHLFQTEGRRLGLRVGLFADEQAARQWLNAQQLSTCT